MEMHETADHYALLRAVSRKHSLSTKLLISILVWVFFAVIFTGYTLTLLWQLESGGIMINKSGSLRMRIYHISTLIDKSDFHKIIDEQQCFENVLDTLQRIDRTSFLLADDNQIQDQVKFIEFYWDNEIKPLIANYYDAGENISAEDLSDLDQFVASIDQLVTLIELQNTKHISLLRFIQSLLILMVFFTAFTAIYFLYKLVIRPLSQLQNGIQALSRGELHSSIAVVGKDEFAVVSSGFNQMASNLEYLYHNLESKVQQKTATLEVRNRELSDLYSITAFLQEPHSQEVISEGFLKQIITLSGANAGSIRLLDEQSDRLNYIASYGLSDEFINEKMCSSLACYCGQMVQKSMALIDHKLIIRERSSPLYNTPCGQSDFNHFITFHLCYNQQKMGILSLYFDHNETLSTQKERLITTLTNQFAIALKNQQLVLRDKQLAVMTERNLIAQGLHDSIAQSLSFLNIQVQMLKNAIKSHETDFVDKSLDFIQQGIQESYENVRELLLNFRTKMGQNDFSQSVQSVLDRFKQQTEVDVHLHIWGDGPSLNPQQELQVIFILQEALSNVRKHAKCNQVRVTIENNEHFLMSIEDNGCGFTLDTVNNKKSQHVGISIMQERAEQVFGTIEIQSVLKQGTRVILTITKEQRGIL